MTTPVVASKTKPFWTATISGPMRIGWGQLGQKKPYVKKKKISKKTQSKLDKLHHNVDLELKRRGA
jgi:hypothetical protein